MLLDFQKEMTCTKTSIVQSSDDKIGVASRDILDIQSAFKNLSTFVDRDRNIQAFFNAGILVRQENISNVFKGKSCIHYQERVPNNYQRRDTYHRVCFYKWKKIQ